MTTIKPTEIKGNWIKGFALDTHTTSSEFLGDSEFGHPQFDTKRSQLGELLYRLKFKSDKSVLDEIITTTFDFIINNWKIIDLLNFIVPVPPSNITRKFQPVYEIAVGLSEQLHVPLTIDSLIKVKGTPELKSVEEIEKRLSILENAFQIKNKCIQNNNVLLFDDLFRSGATLNAATKVLYNNGVKGVYVLTLTRTRSKR